MLCLVALPEEVRLRLRKGQISFAHGRALVGIVDATAIARRIVAERLTVEETELSWSRKTGQGAKVYSTG